MTNEQLKVIRQLNLVIKAAEVLYKDLKKNEWDEVAIRRCGHFVDFCQRAICHAGDSLWGGK